MENNLDYDKFKNDKGCNNEESITAIIASNVADSANKLNSKAIVASSLSGYTAKMISCFRPKCPIIVTTPNVQTARGLSINYGTIPVITPMFNSTDEIVENGLKEVQKLIPLEDSTVIITGSFPVNNSNTNFMKIEKID